MKLASLAAGETDSYSGGASAISLAAEGHWPRAGQTAGGNRKASSILLAWRFLRPRSRDRSSGETENPAESRREENLESEEYGSLIPELFGKRTA